MCEPSGIVRTISATVFVLLATREYRLENPFDNRLIWANPKLPSLIKKTKQFYG